MDKSDTEAVRQQLKVETAFDGLRVFKPKTKRDFAWIAVMGFGVRKMGGVGDSQEEAAVALLEQVLVSTESMFERAVQYKLVEAATLTRVRGLTTRFIADLRKLHAVVVEDRRWETLLKDEFEPPGERATKVEIMDDDVGDDFL